MTGLTYIYNKYWLPLSPFVIFPRGVQPSFSICRPFPRAIFPINHLCREPRQSRNDSPAFAGASCRRRALHAGKAAPTKTPPCRGPLGF